MTTRARARSRSWAAPAASVSNREITERTLHPNVEPAVPAGGPRQSPPHGRGSLEFFSEIPRRIAFLCRLSEFTRFLAGGCLDLPAPAPLRRGRALARERGRRNAR